MAATANHTLQLLHKEVELRSHATIAAAPDWPCRKGCDLCCRRLAAIPALTAAEWDFLLKGIRALPAAERRQVAVRVNELVTSRMPIVCPFLDREQGACKVYAYRPVACRTYGFYVERDRGLYCGQIERRVESGDFASVIWGNHSGVDARLAVCGPAKDLVSWFQSDPPE